MPSKRRNNGRGKKNKGHSNLVRCCVSHRFVPKDKAVARFQMRNIVDGSSKRDIKDNYAYDDSSFVLPKIYVKQYYCISSAIHLKVVRTRSQARGDRNIRYTTKLRRSEHNKTGGFAVPAPQGFGGK